MPELPEGTIALVPDWVCEVLSLVKAPYYARVGVGYLWLVDPDARALLVSRLEGGHWVDRQRFGDETAARVEPFTDVELNIAEWWSLLGPRDGDMVRGGRAAEPTRARAGRRGPT